MTLFDGKNAPSVVYDGAVPAQKAAAMLADDLTALTGKTVAAAPAGQATSGTLVIVGQMDSPGIAALLKTNRIDTAPVAGKWETYGRAVIPAPGHPKDKALLIFGSDMRGAIYGVVDLTREMGVSAWEWWADVTPRRVTSITSMPGCAIPRSRASDTARSSSTTRTSD